MLNSISSFVFDIPTTIEYGLDKFQSIGTLAKEYGDKALVVSTAGESLKELQGKCRSLLEAESIQTVLFNHVSTNPSHKVIDSARDLAIEEGCNLIVGLGGGSAVDVAKAVAVTAAERAGIWDIVDGRPLTHSPLPVIAVPTTSGTGSEVTQYAVISNPEKKMKEGLGKKEFYPVLSIVDPKLTLSMPPDLTAAVGLDALTHAIEGYTTIYSNPVTDSLAETAIGLIGKSLRQAVFHPDDINARSDMMLASMMAGMVITHADTSLSHVIGEALGAVFGIHHGLAVALTLPAVMEFNCFTLIEKFMKIAELLGEKTSDLSPRDAAMHAPSAVRKLIYDTGAPRGLGALNVTEDTRVLELCTREGSDGANPRPASEQDFSLIFKGSLSEKMSYWSLLP